MIFKGISNPEVVSKLFQLLEPFSKMFANTQFLSSENFEDFGFFLHIFNKFEQLFSTRNSAPLRGLLSRFLSTITGIDWCTKEIGADWFPHS